MGDDIADCDVIVVEEIEHWYEVDEAVDLLKQVISEIFVLDDLSYSECVLSEREWRCVGARMLWEKYRGGSGGQGDSGDHHLWCGGGGMLGITHNGAGDGAEDTPFTSEANPREAGDTEKKLFDIEKNFFLGVLEDFFSREYNLLSTSPSINYPEQSFKHLSSLHQEFTEQPVAVLLRTTSSIWHSLQPLVVKELKKGRTVREEYMGRDDDRWTYKDIDIESWKISTIRWWIAKMEITKNVLGDVDKEKEISSPINVKKSVNVRQQKITEPKVILPSIVRPLKKPEESPKMLEIVTGLVSGKYLERKQPLADLIQPSDVCSAASKLGVKFRWQTDEENDLTLMKQLWEKLAAEGLLPVNFAACFCGYPYTLPQPYLMLHMIELNEWRKKVSRKFRSVNEIQESECVAISKVGEVDKKEECKDNDDKNEKQKQLEQQIKKYVVMQQHQQHLQQKQRRQQHGHKDKHGDRTTSEIPTPVQDTNKRKHRAKDSVQQQKEVDKDETREHKEKAGEQNGQGSKDTNQELTNKLINNQTVPSEDVCQYSSKVVHSVEFYNKKMTKKDGERDVSYGNDKILSVSIKKKQKKVTKWKPLPIKQLSEEDKVVVEEVSEWSRRLQSATSAANSTLLFEGDKQNRVKVGEVMHILRPGPSMTQSRSRIEFSNRENGQSMNEPTSEKAKGQPAGKIQIIDQKKHELLKSQLEQNSSYGDNEALSRPVTVEQQQETLSSVVNSDVQQSCQGQARTTSPLMLTVMNRAGKRSNSNHTLVHPNLGQTHPLAYHLLENMDHDSKIKPDASSYATYQHILHELYKKQQQTHQQHAKLDEKAKLPASSHVDNTDKEDSNEITKQQSTVAAQNESFLNLITATRKNFQAKLQEHLQLQQQQQQQHLLNTSQQQLQQVQHQQQLLLQQQYNRSFQHHQQLILQRRHLHQPLSHGFQSRPGNNKEPSHTKH